MISPLKPPFVPRALVSLNPNPPHSIAVAILFLIVKPYMPDSARICIYVYTHSHAENPCSGPCLYMSKYIYIYIYVLTCLYIHKNVYIYIYIHMPAYTQHRNIVVPFSCADTSKNTRCSFSATKGGTWGEKFRGVGRRNPNCLIKP